MRSATEFGLSRIGQIGVNVKDLERAESFYKEALGMKHVFSVPNMSFFDCGGITLMLDIPDKRFEHPSSIIYFEVDDIQKAHSTLAGRGVRFEDEPRLIASLEQYDLWMTFFRDSEENVLALMSKAAK